MSTLSSDFATAADINCGNKSKPKSRMPSAAPSTLRCDVRNFLSSMPPDHVFTTSVLLQFGKRAAVDSVLCRMARNGDIVRLARGVYVSKAGYAQLPPCLDILMTKTFKKRIYIGMRTQQLENGSKPRLWRACGKEVEVIEARSL
jgi:hypothetical protein